jgi:wyosine [tRNA(Phe)-imidazoG37] synthetase (radical SAM superfamily)
LEVFIVPGINDKPEQVERIAELAHLFSPDDISLNTAVRPTADPTLHACPQEKMAALSSLFNAAAHDSGPQNTPIPSNLTPEERAALALRHPLKP